MHQYAGDQRTRFVVPVGFADLAGRVVDERIREGGGILRQIERAGIEGGGRVVGGRGLAGRAKGIEDEHGTEAATGAGGDTGIFSLGVHADDRAVGEQQIGQHGADALAGAGGRDGEQVCRAGIAQQRTPPAGTPPDQEGRGIGGAGRSCQFGGESARAGPARRAHHVGGGGTFEAAEEGQHAEGQAGQDDAAAPHGVLIVARREVADDAEDHDADEQADPAADEQADPAADEGVEQGAAEVNGPGHGAPGRAQGFAHGAGCRASGRAGAAAVSAPSCPPSMSFAVASRSAAKARSPARRHRTKRSA